MIYSWLTKLTISYLSCGVPDLKFDLFSVKLNGSDFEIDACNIHQHEVESIT